MCLLFLDNQILFVLLSLFWKVPGALTCLLSSAQDFINTQSEPPTLRYYHSWSAHGVVSRMDEMFGVGLL